MSSGARGAQRGSVRAFVAALARSAGWRGVGVLVLSVAVAATEGFGLFLLLPLLRLAGIGNGSGSVGALGDAAFRALGALHIPGTLPVMLVLFALVATSRAFLERASVVESIRLHEALLQSMRQRMYAAIVRARWDHLARMRTTDLIHVLTAELERQALGPLQLVSMLTGALLAIVYVGVALRLSATTTLLVIASGALLVGLLRRSRLRARRASESLDALNNDLFGTAAELVDGVKTTKSYGAERRSEELFAALGARVARSDIECERLFANARAVFDIGSVLVLCVGVYAGISLFRLPAGAILLLLYLFTRLTPRLSGLQSSWQNLTMVMPSFNRVRAVMEACEAGSESRGWSGDAEVVPLALRHGVDLVDVNFHYREPLPNAMPLPDESRVERAERRGRAPALRGVTLHIAAGQTTAIVGPSGAGKSTIAELVLGLLAPQLGTVEIDGVPLSAALGLSWRAAVGYVAQDTFLFHDTIRANLLWARPGATDDDLREALRLAAADFVLRLPEGLDTVVGDRGIRLSGGERQRLALARALLRHPALLVLDEATSALDSENERRIQAAVDSLHGRMGVLVITHRIEAVRSADRIYVLEDGVVVEKGRWRDLLARGGRFAELARAHGITAGEEVPIPA